MIADRAGYLGRMASFCRAQPRSSTINRATLAEASRGFVSDSWAFLSRTVTVVKREQQVWVVTHWITAVQKGNNKSTSVDEHSRQSLSSLPSLQLRYRLQTEQREIQTPSSHWNCVRTLQTTTQLTTVETCCLALWYGPVYLSHCLCPAWLQSIKTVSTDEGRRQLRCAKSRTCVVRRTYSNYGDRCFAAAGPKLWNSLPTDLRQAGINFQRHKRLLTIFLFGWWDRAALLLTVKAAPHKFSFYLLTYLLTQAHTEALEAALHQWLAQEDHWDEVRRKCG